MTYARQLDGTDLVLNDQDNQERFRRLVDHNGGWFVMGCREQKRVGDVGESSGVRFVVIAEASKEDAMADSAFLGLDFLDPRPYYYKVMAD